MTAMPRNAAASSVHDARNPTMTHFRSSTLVIGAAVLAACTSGSTMQMRSDTGDVAGGRAAASAPALTDANIAAIVVAANTIDIKNAELALEKSKNEAIRTFAQTMVTDHSGVNKAAVDLVTKLKVTPVPNETSAGLTKSADDTRAALAKKSGADFDRAYIANEVAYHTTVLGAVDSALIPGASNADLKALLVSVRPAFVAHLEHAKQLSASLGN
jgi:putative membrane protein